MFLGHIPVRVAGWGCVEVVVLENVPGTIGHMTGEPREQETSI